MSSNSSWNKMTLQDAGVSLIDCDHRTPPHAESGYAYIAIPQLKDGHIRLDGVRLISEVDYLEWTKKLKPEEDDVIVVRRCNSGDSAVVPANFKCAIGQNLVVLRASGEIVDKKFLRWLIRSPDWWEQVNKFINVGAVFDSLKCREIPQFELPIPPMYIQKEIALILGAIDNRIQLLRETNTTLESIAQALFKSWFVDFDPVHANAGTQAPSLPPEIQSLFPSTFVESSLGLVPEGWGVDAVYNLANYINGAAYKAFEPNSDRRGFPIIKIAELKAGVTTQTAYSDVEMNEKYRIDNKEVLFSWSGNPDTSIDTFVWLHGKAWLNQHIFKVVPHEPHDRSFVLLMLKYLNPVFAEIARDKQTTGLGHVTVADLKRLQIVKPSNEILFAWNEIVDPIIERSYLVMQKANRFSQLRDTLLPRLISGQLRLPEVEELLEATA